MGTDTVSCYTNKEVRKINEAIQSRILCDTLLAREKKESFYLLKQIQEYESIRIDMERIVTQKDIIIESRDEMIRGRDRDISVLKKEIIKQKVWKVIGTGFFAVTTIVALIL